MKKFIIVILLIFLSLFIYKSINTMNFVPFHDFDEANRAETARNMKIYQSYFAPLTGSPFLEGNNIVVKAKQNKLLSLNYHLERPPLYYLSMIATTSIFKDSEFFYRLPSFIFGLLTMIVLAISINQPFAILAFLTSADWWLSSQSALMDTSLSFFLFLSFIFILKFLDKNNIKFIFFSGLSLGGAILCKGQPAIIFIFPLIFLLLTRKINFKQLLILFTTSFVTLLPWLLLAINKFGLDSFISTFLGFAKIRTLVQDTSQLAPIYWYGRWWIESFRVGLVLFMSLIIHDLLNGNFKYKKSLIIFYFLSSFVFFSIAKNKVWWYVLPLIPICCLYIGLSITDIIKKWSNKLFNFSIIIFLSSIPIFYKTSNKISIAYGIFLVIFSIFILSKNFNIKKIFINIFFIISIIFSLLIFLINFPKITPTFPEAKQIGEYYQKLPQPKCLYVQSMPYEAVLFYTQAEEIKYYQKATKLNKKCNNYLITSDNIDNAKLVKMLGYLKLFDIDTY